MERTDYYYSAKSDRHNRLIYASRLLYHNNETLTNALRFIKKQGGQFVGVALSGNPSNAVNPAWRDALIDTAWNFTAPWDEMVANQDLMINVLVPALAALTPNGSCYLNEGDFRQPDFQSVFYGTNYQKLNRIKNKYDQHHLFYAVTGVGSEYWEPQADGRLCISNSTVI